MNEENIKLQRVQRSCKVAQKVSFILFMITMVSCVICLITGIVMIANHENFDAQINQASNEGKIVQYPDGGIKLNLGPVNVADIDKNDIEKTQNFTNNLHSDIPALQEFFEENQNSLSLMYGFYLLGMTLMIAILTVALYLFYTIFSMILKEGNPFADKVMKRILVSMIIISVVLALTAGIGFGALCGFLTWVIYTILDYGRSLKTLSDETL